MKKGVFSGYNRNIDPLNDLDLSRCEDDFKCGRGVVCNMQASVIAYSAVYFMWHINSVSSR